MILKAHSNTLNEAEELQRSGTLRLEPTFFQGDDVKSVNRRQETTLDKAPIDFT